MLLAKMDGLLVIFSGTKLQVDAWVFKAKKGSSASYHQEMNAENFDRWFQEKFPPVLPAICYIVMDNASYH